MSTKALEENAATPALQQHGAEEPKILAQLQLALGQEELQDHLTENDKKSLRLSSTSCRMGVDSGTTRLLINCLDGSTGEGTSLTHLKRLHGSFTRLAEIRMEVLDASEAKFILTELDQHASVLRVRDETRGERRPALEMLTHLSFASWSKTSADALIELLKEKKALESGHKLTFLQVPFQFATQFAGGPARALESDCVVFDRVRGWSVLEPSSFIQWHPIGRPQGDSISLEAQVGVWTEATVLRLEHGSPFVKDHLDGSAGASIACEQLKKDLQNLEDFVFQCFARLQSVSLLWTGPCVPNISLIGTVTRVCLDAWVDHVDRGKRWHDIVTKMPRLSVLELAINVNFDRGYIYNILKKLSELTIVRIFHSCTKDTRHWLENVEMLPEKVSFGLVRDTMCPLILLHMASSNDLRVIEMRGGWTIKSPLWGVSTSLQRFTSLQRCILTVPTLDVPELDDELRAMTHVCTELLPFPIEEHMPAEPEHGLPSMFKQVLVDNKWLFKEYRAWSEGSYVFRRGVPWQEPTP